jgi:hypothetical protein
MATPDSLAHRRQVTGAVVANYNHNSCKKRDRKRAVSRLAAGGRIQLLSSFQICSDFRDNADTYLMLE